MRGDNASGGDFERSKTRLWYRVACSRDFGKSKRVHWEVSKNLAPAPARGSKASHRCRERSPWQAISVRAHQVGRFRRELRIVALAPGFTVLAQEAPNILNVNGLFQRFRQQAARPRSTLRRLLPKAPNALVRQRTSAFLLLSHLEVESFPRQRAICERLLPILSYFKHRVAHLAEH
jgi:hypothetical protein